MQTTDLIIKALNKNDPREFQSYFGFSDLKVINKTEEMITSDVSTFSELLHQYSKRRGPNVEFTDRVNFLGQKQVKLIFFSNHKDSAVKEMHLNILFGPPNIASLNRISGYELVTNNRDSSQFHPISYWHK